MRKPHSRPNPDEWEHVYNVGTLWGVSHTHMACVDLAGVQRGHLPCTQLIASHMRGVLPVALSGARAGRLRGDGGAPGARGGRHAAGACAGPGGRAAPAAVHGRVPIRRRLFDAGQRPRAVRVP